MKINYLDHCVLYVTNIAATIDFYTRILGMELITFGANRERKALHFGSQKLNLVEVGREHTIKPDRPIPGSADLCFITETPIQEVQQRLNKFNVKIITGPVDREGARGPLISLYCYDPEGNLIEISNYLKAQS